MDIIDWRTLIDRNDSQMASFDAFVGTLTTKNLTSYGFAQ